MEIRLSKIVGGGYKDFWNCTKRYRVVKGSRGSKKSKTTALNLIYRMMKYPEANALVMRRTFETLTNSCYSDLRGAVDKLQVSDKGRFTVNPLEVTYIPTNQKILFRGFDKALKVTSISVPKGVLCGVGIEEAYEVNSESDFDKIDLSIRGEVPEGLFKQITFTFNPGSAQSGLKKRFFDTPDEDVFTKTTTYKCNEGLDKEDIRLFEKMKVNNPRRYRIEGEGEGGIAEGLIYENFELKEFDVNELRLNPNIRAGFGLDFGFTDPTAFVCFLLDEDDEKIYIFDEFYEYGMTNAKIYDKIMDMGYGGQHIIADCAEPKSIQELRELGLNIEGSRKGRDSVVHGIQRIQNYKIVVNPKCTNFWHEINNYCGEKDKYDKPTDKPCHDFSHAMDALRYGTSRMMLGNVFSFD